MATNEVRLTYIADISDALAGMNNMEKATRAQIAEVNRANAALSAFDRGQKATAGMATGKLTPALRQTRFAAQNLQAQFFDIGVGLQGGQNPFTILIQQGPQVIQAMTGVGGGVAAAKAALTSMLKVVGPVALAIGTMIAAWKAYTEETNRSNEMTERAQALQVSMQGILDDTRSKLVDLAEATGDLTEAEARHVREAITGLSKWQAATSDTRKKLSELRKEQGSVTTQMADWAEKVTAAIPTGWVMNKLIDGLTTSTAEYQQEIDGLNQALNDTIPKLEKNVEVTRDLADNKQRAADATRAQSAAEREHAALVAGVKASNDEFIADLRERGALQDAVQAQTRADFAEEFNLARKTRQSNEKDEADRLANFGKTSLAITGLVASQGQEIALIGEEVASRLGASAQTQAAFAKASAILGVAVNTAAGITRSIAILGPPVPPNVPGIAGVASAIGIGAAQAALVATQQVPSFGDTPGPVFAGSGGMTASFAPGDFVIASQTRAGLQRQATGGLGVGSAQTEVTMRYRHRSFNAFIADNIRQPGSPLGDAIRTPTTHATRG